MCIYTRGALFDSCCCRLCSTTPERSQRKVLVSRMRLRTSIFLELRRRTLTLHQFEPHASPPVFSTIADSCSCNLEKWRYLPLARLYSCRIWLHFARYLWVYAANALHACMPFSVPLRYTLALPPLRVAGCCAGSYVSVYRVQPISRQPHASH